MRNIHLFLLLTLFPFAGFVSAQEIDEDALFADTSFMVDSADVVDESLAGEPESTRVSFSGEVTTVGAASVNRDWFESTSASDVSGSAAAVGNLYLDVRLPRGVKTFAGVEVSHSAAAEQDETVEASVLSYSGGTPTELYLRELFVDVNVERRAYLRMGKQVLQWGRTWFWNPTDLVNVEKKSFVEKIGAREGTFGVKLHVPFGTRANIYSFLDLNDLSRVKNAAGALRGEVLVGGTELGVGIWGKPDEKPVFGFDMSSSILGFSITGELSLEHGSRFTVVEDVEIVLGDTSISDPSRQFILPGRPGKVVIHTRDLDNVWVPRLSVGVMRMFDLLNVDDRVTAIAEFYYNHAGVEENVFQGEMSSFLTSPGPGSLPANLQNVFGEIYEPNNHSKYYAAFFTTVDKFITSDLALTLNGIINLSHGAAVISSGLNYTTLHNFSLGFLVNSYLGEENTEYTFMNNAFDVRLTAGVAF